MITAHQLADQSITLMQAGIKEFGQYSFFDKGPDEVMDIVALSQQFREAGPDLAVAALKLILVAEGNAAENEHLVHAIVMAVDDWDEAWELHGEFLGLHY